jgi:uncharacterized membrane protein HdeD (DUF308 family)
VLALLGLQAMIWPSLVEMDMMSGGFALRFVGMFVAISGLVTLWVYGDRYRAVQRIFNGQGLLAHWSYDPEEARRLAREEFESRSQQNRNLFGLVAGMMVVAGLLILVLPMLRGEDPCSGRVWWPTLP